MAHAEMTALFALKRKNLMKHLLQHLLLQCVCRFKMRPFLGGELDEPIRAPLHSHFGNVTLQLYPPLIKQDFYQQYHQPTFWPYCSSLEECVVYRWAGAQCMLQMHVQSECVCGEEGRLMIALPSGEATLDFYINLAATVRW